MDVLSEQIAYYRARAADYDDWWERRFEFDLGERFAQAWRAEAERLRDALDSFAPHGDVLELAAGIGIWTGRLLRRADHVTAVDAAPEALAINRAKHRDRDVTYVTADLFTWRPPRRFDAICFGFWISHVPTARWAEFWRLVDRALAPAGRVWFCDSAHPKHAAAHGPKAMRDRDDAAVGSERQRRCLRDGRSFQVVKRYWWPAQLEAELAASGWDAAVRHTDWAFMHGSATRAADASCHPDLWASPSLGLVGRASHRLRAAIPHGRDRCAAQLEAVTTPSKAISAHAYAITGSLHGCSSWTLRDGRLHHCGVIAA